MAEEGAKYFLQATDGEPLPISTKALKMSVTLSNMIEDVPDGDAIIPLPTINALILGKIIEFCEHHCTDVTVNDDNIDLSLGNKPPVGAWDAELFPSDKVLLVETANAANYLDIKLLYGTVCHLFADLLTSWGTAEKIRSELGIVNDFDAKETADGKKLASLPPHVFDGF